MLTGLQDHSCCTLHCYTAISALSFTYLRYNLLCAANSKASTLGKPIMTPPSAIASSTNRANAGPEPQTAVHASKCFSSRKRHRPIGWKRDKAIDRSRFAIGADVGIVERTVMPSLICGWMSADQYDIEALDILPTLQGVLGIALNTRADDGVQDLS